MDGDSWSTQSPPIYKTISRRPEVPTTARLLLDLDLSSWLARIIRIQERLILEEILNMMDSGFDLLKTGLILDIECQSKYNISTKSIKSTNTWKKKKK